MPNTKYKSTSVKSKWTKTKWLLRNAYTSKFVPRTKLFTRSNLRTMLNRYSTVFFKPTGGSGGFRIYRIKTLADGGYQLRHNATKSYYGSFDSLYARLGNRAGGRSYLLQKGIRLAKTGGRPFDIRVMVQKSNEGDWVSTAMFAKIGRPGKIATNYNQGGKIGRLRSTLRGAGYGNGRIDKKEAELKRLGRSVGRLFDRRISGFKELGLDVALDGTGRSWILEVNTRPQYYPLRRLGYRSLYKRISRYSKQYGRKR
ncbi:YheC/YheD family protein [Cohnella sp. GCM10027633]|uniref:YheC/YheD family protein n=1 Tax=unclassified Cohnella TaxID=2636738 RepID=UPI003641A134